MTVVTFDRTAEHRLHDLGLDVPLLVRALQRADAEAKQTTGLEPPTAEGSTRYFKTVRFLREELVPLGWDPDNYRNFCRTVHPSRRHSIVVSSGDEFTGLDIHGTSPRTKYPKGDLTEVAVQRNAVQDAFDFGEEFAEPIAERVRVESTWYLLQYTTPQHIQAEVSLPTAFKNGMITDWQERILLPLITREDPGSAEGATFSDPGPGDTDGDAYSFDITMR
ncbi:hypothetical protein [Microlunatus sp. GCM10028923]|uniref:hypothetical protein n=1 Tax=Microlunatus sp. GCM10028923 TaxID=3273400 RepID=UPI00361F32DA